MTERLLLTRPGRTADQTYIAANATLRCMRTGGHEGEKIAMEVPFLQACGLDEKPNIAEPRYFVAKAFSSLEEVLSLIDMSRDLSMKNYPAPTTEYYFTRRDDTTGREVFYAVIEDMRKNDAYLLWGQNEFPTTDEDNELRAMNLSGEDVTQLHAKAHTLAQQANQDGYYFHWSSYHVRRNKETGELDIVLLDVSPRTYTLRLDNTDPANKFIENLADMRKFLYHL